MLCSANTSDSDMEQTKLISRGQPPSTLPAAIYEGGTAPSSLVAISVCVFCELGPKKISFLTDQPTQKKMKRARERPQKSIGPAQLFQISLSLSLSLNRFSSGDGPHSTTPANLFSNTMQQCNKTNLLTAVGLALEQRTRAWRHGENYGC